MLRSLQIGLHINMDVARYTCDASQSAPWRQACASQKDWTIASLDGGSGSCCHLILSPLVV